MLTARSRAVCAWQMPYGDILCPECALGESSPLELARLEAGIATEHEGSPIPMIAYNLDTYHGERQWEEAQALRSEGRDEEAEALENSEEGYPCDNCGKEIET